MDNRPTSPPSSIVLAFGPVLLLALAALLSWALHGPARLHAIVFGQLWGSAILLFLAGVVRGLSFDRPAGAELWQLAFMTALFLLGLAGLVLHATPGFVLLAVGYAAIGVVDRVAARSGYAPAHFAHLRPPQMAIAVLALGLLALRTATLA